MARVCRLHGVRGRYRQLVWIGSLRSRFRGSSFGRGTRFRVQGSALRQLTGRRRLPLAVTPDTTSAETITTHRAGSSLLSHRPRVPVIRRRMHAALARHAHNVGIRVSGRAPTGVRRNHHRSPNDDLHTYTHSHLQTYSLNHERLKADIMRS